MRTFPVWLGLVALLQLACSELPSIPASGCGNRLVELQSEDCDGVASEPGTRCAGPGEAHACRFVCVSSTGEGFACPGGYACGLDGVCRTPSGAFQQAGRSVEVAASRLLVGDFDDNKQDEILAMGTGDILGRVSSQVVFFSQDAERATTQVIPGFLGNPVVGRFADSPYDGIAFSSIPGVAMLIGRRDRQFFPRSYPSFPSPADVTAARLYSMEILPAVAAEKPGELRFLGDEPLLFATSSTGHDLISIATEGDRHIAALPQGPDALLGDLVQGRFDETLSCPTLMFPFAGASELLLVTPCESDGKGGMRWVAPGTPPKKIPFPPGLVLQGKPVVGDVDGDSHLDLLFSAAENTQGLLFVAYGDGLGGLHTSPGGQGAPGFDFFTVPASQALPPCGYEIPQEQIGDPALAAKLKGRAIFPPVLAAADLDGDQRIDFVLPYGVCSSRDLASPQGPPLYTLKASPLGGLWGEVLTIDLNDDGRLDVLGAPETSRSLDLFLGTSQGLFNTVTLPLNGSASQLLPGDFDGDGSPDVVFRERGVQGTSNVGAATGDAVTVLFSSPKQIPSGLVRVGRFDQVDHLTSGLIPDNPLATDAISEIGVISRTAASKDDVGALSISLFYGSSDRALRSPLILGGSADSAGGLSLPILAASGRFTEHSSAAQQDLLVLGMGDQQGSMIACPGSETSRDTGLRLWLVALAGDARLDGVFPGEFLDLGGEGGVSIECSERAQLSAGDLDGDGFDEAVLAVPLAAESKLFVGRTGGQARAPELLPPRALPFGLAPESPPLLVDLDGDGRRDAIFLTLSGEGARNLAVLWGRGDGTFEEEISSLILPDQELKGACTTRDGGVLLLSDKGLLRLGRLGGSRTLSAVSAEQFTSEQRGGVALACGDLDGDGVDDVAISSGSLVRVFRGLPVRP